MGTELVVTGPSGQVQQGPARLVDNTVAEDLEPGASAGTCTVLWRVTSIDGHRVPAEAARTAPGRLGWGLGLLVVGLVAAVGVLPVRRRRPGRSP